MSTAKSKNFKPSTACRNSEVRLRRQRGLVAGTLAFLWLAALPLAGQCRPDQTAAAFSGIRIHLASLQIASLARDHVTLRLIVQMRAPHALHVTGLEAENVHLNGLPLFVAGWRRDVRLQAGEPTLLPQPLRLTLYYRDWRTAASFQQAIQRGYATLSGQVRVGVSPEGLAHLLVQHVEVETSVQQQIPVDVPGGKLGREAAVHALGVVVSTAEWLGGEFTTLTGSNTTALQKQVASRLVLGESHLIVHTAAGDRSWSCSAMGWFIQGDRIVIPATLVEPWKYDAEIAAAVAAAPGGERKTELDLTVWSTVGSPGGQTHAAHAWTLSHHDVTVLKVGTPELRKVYVPTDMKKGKARAVRVASPQDAGDLALLACRGCGAPGFALLPAVAAAPEEPGGGVVFRLTRDGKTGRMTTEELTVPLVDSGAGRQLAQPLDASAWGSPVLGQGGVIGIVQGGTGILRYSAALRRLGLHAGAASVAAEARH